MTDQADLIEQVLGGVTDVGVGDLPGGVAEAFEEMAAESQRRRSERRAQPELVVEPIPGAVIRPGDVLVVSAGQNMSEEQCHEVKRRLHERMPMLTDVVVLAGDLTVAGVYREEGV